METETAPKPRKGGRAKNSALTAERKAILSLVEAEKGESAEDAVARVIREKDQENERLKKLLKLNSEALADKEAEDERRAAKETQAQVATIAAGQSEKADVGPIGGLPTDYAFYPKPGEQYRQPEPPPGTLTAREGDLGEAYVRWFLSANGPDETRKKYGHGTTNNRIYLLPPDVQAALK